MSNGSYGAVRENESKIAKTFLFFYVGPTNVRNLFDHLIWMGYFLQSMLYLHVFVHTPEDHCLSIFIYLYSENYFIVKNFTLMKF